MNREKTKYIVFTGNRKKETGKNLINLIINGIPIERVEKVTFLGVNIDSDLSWKTNISYVQTEIASVIGVISKIRYKLTNKSSLSIYDGLINSHLHYCNIAWGSTYKSKLAKIAALQKKH